jgi:hypothetical protein
MNTDDPDRTQLAVFVTPIDAGQMVTLDTENPGNHGMLEIAVPKPDATLAIDAVPYRFTVCVTFEEAMAMPNRYGPGVRTQDTVICW